jgi:hypothetical protein
MKKISEIDEKSLHLADVFAIGLILIRSALLYDDENVRTYRQFDIPKNVEYRASEIAIIKKRYGPLLGKILEIMTE